MQLEKNSFSYKNPLKIKFYPEFFKNIDQNPGVYFMLNRQKTILYIGKAKNLQARITSYSQIKPGQAAESTLEMIESIADIQWNICKSEEEAILKESELLHAIRPPYNIVGTEAEHYLFLGIRYLDDSTRSLFLRDPLKVDFRLSSHDKIKSEGYTIYGCFKHRQKIKQGYTALMRLIYASSFATGRFSYPSKITRVSPPWLYSTFIPKVWKKELILFLKGKKGDFLTLVVNRLLENEIIPHFMYPSLQDDIEVAKSFFEFGPRATFLLKRKYKISSSTLSHKKMDILIQQEHSIAVRF